jgi:sugar (pentulose or hexulose) kinase
MNNNGILLGIDAGTTRIKASLYDLDLNEIGKTSEDVKIYSPMEGASEIDMKELWTKLCSITNRLKIAHANIWNNMIGIGISGQGDGLWPIDDKGEPVCRAILWNDTRSKVLNIDEIEGLEDLLKKECANNIYPGSMPALQKWLKIKKPEVYHSINTSLHCKDWLNYKLTGKAVSEYSDIVCSSGINIKTLRYIPELYELLDIKEMLGTMPEPVKPSEIIGSITKRASLECGIPEGVPVIAGCLDCCAASVGASFYRKRQVCSVVGTAMINEVSLGYDEINPDDLRGLLLYHVVEGRYIKIMNTAAASSSVDYIKNLVCPDVEYKELFDEILKLPIGSEGVLFHPYLFGERAPFKNPYAFASVFGMRSHHTKYHLMRAAYEGLAMMFFDCYNGVQDIDLVLLSGGPCASSFVCQMFADAIGKLTRKLVVDELGTLGIIKMLMVTLGYAKTYQELDKGEYIEYVPDPHRHKLYMELYQKFISLRKSIEPYWVK